MTSYTEADYQRERAICDKAQAYWKAHASYDRSGASSMTAEQAAHPDYAACDNAMRGRVEAWELQRDKPAVFFAYLDAKGEHVTTWLGDVIGRVTRLRRSTHRTWNGARHSMYHVHVTAFGKRYHGKGSGPGMCITLRAFKSK
jgi:hypothetical protein